MRKHGLACDNLISADLVTADGQTGHAGETENAELLWGLRGGGGNFGVVTEFEFRLHPVSQVLGGLVAWPAPAARDVLRFWRDWVRDTPDELCTMAAFLYAPPEPFVPPEVVGMPIFAIACCHLDLEGRAEDDLQPLRDLGPAVDVIGPMPYVAIQDMFDGGVPRGSRNQPPSGLEGAVRPDELLSPEPRHPAGVGNEPQAADGLAARRINMAELAGKRFESPDEIREFTDDKRRIELVDLNGNAVGRGSFAPGWRWSKNVKPLAGTDSCQVEHIGYVLQGRMALKMDDGTEREFGPGDAFHMPPGHDAWIVGDETCVLLDFGGFAQAS
jgi:hypothetical protein